MAAHVTVLIIVRLNSSILEAFGLNQQTVVRNQVNLHSSFFVKEFLTFSLMTIYRIHKLIFTECRRNTDCNTSNDPDKKICQAGRCIRNINIFDYDNGSFEI